MLMPGICYIKKEFLLEEPDNNGNVVAEHNKRKLADSESVAMELGVPVTAQTTTDDNGVASGGTEPPKKFQKTKNERKRGQNKKRPVYKDDRTMHLCYSLMNGPDPEATCKYEKCRYVHDLDVYLAAKGADLGEECPIFRTSGFCSRGVTCRYAKSHLDASGRNVKAAHYDETAAARGTLNGITTELQLRLRKHEYDYTRGKQAISAAEKQRDASKRQRESNAPENGAEPKPIGDEAKPVAVEPKPNGDKAESIAVEAKPIGAVVEDDAAAKCPVDFREKLMLSPLTTVGNLPFRRICKEFGADITCGEMACALPLAKGLMQEWALTKRHHTEDIFGVQLCGNNPNIISYAAQLLQDTAQVDFLDLNIGCPIDFIYQQGGGSALMRRTNILEVTVRSCALLSPQVPFTVKMRNGVYAYKSLAHELVPLVEEWGAAAVTVHGRSREQRYTRMADWEYIEKCAAAAKRMPVIGNGDILNFEDYNERRQLAPHVSSVMIGRGALIKPWIFKEIKEQKHWQPTATQRFELLRKYCDYGLEHWGSDTKGVENTRRFMLEWQSFLYRYIPYDLLAYPPQKINQRPQKFRGRDEMETLLSSPNSSDWVKLSEMLLGPVPEGYVFVPKHKANSY